MKAPGSRYDKHGRAILGEGPTSPKPPHPPAMGSGSRRIPADLGAAIRAIGRQIKSIKAECKEQRKDRFRVGFVTIEGMLDDALDLLKEVKNQAKGLSLND